MSDRLATLRSMLDDEPNDPLLRYGYAFELGKVGRSEEAVEWYRRTLEVDPDAHYAAYHGGRLLADDGLEAEAMEWIQSQLGRARQAGDAKAAGELAALLDELEP